MPSRSRRAAGSEKTMLASASRSSPPPGASTLGPNRSTTFSNPGVPGATACRARTSASKTTAPRFSSIRATVDLPEPMPPVRPTSSMGVLLGAALAPAKVLQDGFEGDVLVGRRRRFLCRGGLPRCLGRIGRALARDFARGFGHLDLGGIGSRWRRFRRLLGRLLAHLRRLRPGRRGAFGADLLLFSLDLPLRHGGPG